MIELCVFELQGFIVTSGAEKNNRVMRVRKCSSYAGSSCRGLSNVSGPRKIIELCGFELQGFM